MPDQTYSVALTAVDPAGHPVPGVELSIVNNRTGRSSARYADGTGYTHHGLVGRAGDLCTLQTNGYRIAAAQTYLTLPASPTFTVAVIVEPRRPAVARRAGIVRLEGHRLVDDLGNWRPFGESLFWALQNLDEAEPWFKWCADRGCTDLRISTSLPWPDRLVDPTVSGFDQRLATLIDRAFDTYGLRLQLTGWGGPDANVTPWLVRAAEITRDVVNSDNRAQKITFLEGCNEADVIGCSASTLQQVVDILRQTPCLVASSSRQVNDDEPSVIDGIRNTTIRVIHSQRNEDAERSVRQAHEFHGQYGSNNEPPGPRSSVAEMTDPRKLAMLCGLAIIRGCPSFVFHNGNGVTGLPQPDRNRYGPLDSVEGIDAMMFAPMNIGRLIPDGAEDWIETTQHAPEESIGPQQLTAWRAGDGDAECDRCYGAYDGARQFVQLICEVRKDTPLSAAQACHVVVHDPLDGRVVEARDLAAGERFTVSPAVSDYVIVGTVR